jgi:SAM-dependent methyltransferase
MGFIRGNIIPILKECKRRPFSGSLLLLGQGDIYFDISRFRKFASQAGVCLNDTIPIRPSHAPEFALKGYPHCETIFRMLGFSSIFVLDYSDFQGADIIFDLNSDRVPRELAGKFDAIIDHGTLEHVFHYPNALNSVFRMLRVGGRAIFSAPSNNYFDHGFYMLQPTLFADWFEANQWKIESIEVAQFTSDQEVAPCFFVDYETGLFDSVSYGKMDGKLYSTIAIATKTSATTGDICPQQGLYARQAVWSQRRSAPESADSKLIFGP